MTLISMPQGAVRAESKRCAVYARTASIDTRDAYRISAAAQRRSRTDYIERQLRSFADLIRATSAPSIAGRTSAQRGRR
jgi:hypothetical protein